MRVQHFVVIKISLEFNKNIRGLLRRVDALESRTVSGPGLGQGYFNFSPTNHQGESVAGVVVVTEVCAAQD